MESAQLTCDVENPLEMDIVHLQNPGSSYWN